MSPGPIGVSVEAFQWVRSRTLAMVVLVVPTSRMIWLSLQFGVVAHQPQDRARPLMAAATPAYSADPSSWRPAAASPCLSPSF